MTETFYLNPGEVLDRLGYQGLQIIQDPQKFKFTVDAFLLVSFIQPRSSHKLIDLGTGGGVIPLLVAERHQFSEIYGVEIQSELADMAKRSIVLNQQTEKVKIIEGDWRDLSSKFPPNSLDYVVTNPPFFPASKGLPSNNPALAAAKFEMNGDLEQLLKTVVRLIKGNGKFAIIYPTERFGELLLKLNAIHLTPKRIRFIHPQLSVPSHLFLLEAQPGGKQGTTILPPLFIYDESSNYSVEMNQIFHGKAT